ncbi:MAG: TOBE domain-containing protein [Eubacteriales bacterium]|nr:TOBE domain-containing protein [Eubacteriales bacterium]
MISTRNNMSGKVSNIIEGSVNCLVQVDLGNGEVGACNTSLKTVKELGLAQGTDVKLLFKAPTVIVANEQMNVGTQNKFYGKVVEAKKGDIVSLVKIETKAGNKISSLITTESFDEMNVQVGNEMYAYVKAMNVVLSK